MSAPEIRHIESSEGTCGGAPRIAGTRIRVSQIALLTEQGRTADEIIAAYPHLTLADVHAALAYYHDHRAIIDEEIEQAEAEYSRLIGAAATEGRKSHGASVPSR
jgi:uncharacterized protein (DUF433 family)